MPPRKTRKTIKKSNRSAAKKATKVAKKATRRPTQRGLSSSHKKALAEGRTMSAIVDRYLAAVNTPRRRGRKVMKATLEQRLTAARAQVKVVTGVENVLAAQQIRDPQGRIAER